MASASKKGRPRKSGPRKPCGRLIAEQYPSERRDQSTGAVLTREPAWHVYVIGPAIGPLKIGTAHDVERRREALQTACPYPLEVLYLVEVGPKARAVEFAVHKRLQARRCAGEWFRVSTREAVAAIKLELMERAA